MSKKVKRFGLEFQENNDGSYSCYISPLPVIGRGNSPAEALQTFANAIPDVYESWAENLCIEHAENGLSLKAYKELTYMVSSYTNDKHSALYYTPIK